MFFDQDIVQRIKVFGIFALQFYKVMTGTMLTLFIPQACYIDNEREQLKICSLTENYENTEVFHKTTFYWNGFSFFLFIMTYILELRREHWAIKYLDINNDIPDNALKEKIVLEPELDRVMDKLNKFYFDKNQYKSEVKRNDEGKQRIWRQAPHPRRPTPWGQTSMIGF